MATIWKRPESIRFPKVWKMFTGSIAIEGRLPEFWIQDVTENMFDTVLEMMVAEFIEEEISVKEAQNLWRKTLEQRLSLVCFFKAIHRISEIVCISLNCRTTPSDPQITFRGPKFASRWYIRQQLLHKYNFYEDFNVDQVLVGAGGITVPQYLNQNIAIEMVKCRELLCKATGMKISFLIVTPELEEEMERVGFKRYTSLTSEELNEINKSPNNDTYQRGQCLKLMYNFYE